MEQPLRTDTVISHYRILSRIGAGGMGEVYRARDTRLNREVAIKVLPASFANDEDRLRRFEQEANATSALNHPNILTVYDIGSHEDTPYIVAELLEGEELRAVLNDGAIGQRKAIDYAQQVVSGLAAAHSKAIVHRDLKPENIFITTDGRVKILDFGLAKLSPPKLAAGASSEVATQQAITDPGTVMGTVGYMSPEQVRGHAADYRSDIFSFGAILYEMLRGRRAFIGESAIEVMNAILKEEPEELTQTNSKINPALERIVHRCLEKKPERRFQSTSDLCFAIEALSMPSGSGASQTEAWKVLNSSPIAEYRNWRGRIAWIVAGVLTAALVALSIAYFNRSSKEPSAARLAFAPPEGLTFENGVYDFVIVSPDGQKLAFTAWSADGKKQIWVRPLNSSEAQPLPGTDDPQYPFWSPDSRSIGFGSRGKLKRIDLESGRPQTLADAPDLRGGTWSRKDVILFQPRPQRAFFQIPATGGEAQAVTDLTPDKQGFRNPRFLPDGRHFLYDVGAGESAKGIFVGSLDSKEVKRLLADGTFAEYAPPGWLIFERNGGLVAQSFDADRLEVSDEAFVLTPHASVTRPRFSVSENGVLVWQGNQWRDYQLVWFDREGRQAGAVGPSIRAVTPQGPRLSPDGTRVSIARTDRQSQNTDIWVIDLLRNLPTRVTSDPIYEAAPVWSSDGNHLVFGTGTLWQKAANGTGTKETLLRGEENQIYPRDWSSDGRFIIYVEKAIKTNEDVWVLPLTGDRHPYPIINSEFDERETQLSRDGRWLAYVSDESDRYEVYVQAFNADGKLGETKVRISTGGGNQPRWRRDGQELFYIAADGQMMAVAVKSGGTAFEAGTPKALFKTRMFKEHNVPAIDYDVTADGQRFLIGTLVGEATPVSVILNWTAELKK
ncbi:MAG TPA: protein kinase [Blastocatellia bacterium]|nr:protein kinase [Blastocatellia bacterium]